MNDESIPAFSDLLDRHAAGERREQNGSDDPADRLALVLGSDGVAQPLLHETQSRRMFLARTSALSLAIPGVGVALAACSSGDGRRDTTRTGAQTPAATAGPASAGQQPHNSDSRLDSAVLKGEHHTGTSATGAPTQGGANVTYHRYAPELPPLPAAGKQQRHFHAREAPVRISDDTVLAAWTFEGDVPGPIVHTRVGDTVEFTLTNDVEIPHSMDFHAAQLNPKEAFKSVTRNQSLTFSFKPRYAGAFMYHCGTAPVLMHIGSGMFGAIIVSPLEGLPSAKDFVLVQNEFYLADAGSGTRSSDYQKMLSMIPDIVCFNGRPNQYVKEPIRVRRGDRVRFWVVSAGPSHPCNFHMVGEQFDTVYLGSPPGNSIRGVQTFTVPPGGGIVYELVCDVAGEFPFVNHGFGHGQKGAIGLLVVEG
jgi:nitrite reductase (NO-forming)